ncbi:hypothetical protein T265_10307 [Opisthorchis viverrini]|uniref:Uncharacterized protein n=1 Tax=Opisthorchis viverrini TaxID=6198 RepID=A0A074Z707_OPIVI|nr:hypothetical protein T265_10307 [Opisthorchis viverrini]KER21357.1 hypothetical protein T265_10307 [Opisthorchis viverrini]
MVPVYRIFIVVAVSLLVFTVTAPSQESVREKASGEKPTTKEPEEQTTALHSEDPSDKPQAAVRPVELTSNKSETVGVSEVSKEDQGGKWVFITNEELMTILQNMTRMDENSPAAVKFEGTSGTEETPTESNKKADEEQTSVKTTKATVQPE